MGSQGKSELLQKMDTQPVTEDHGPLDIMLEPKTLVIDNYSTIVTSLRGHLLEAMKSKTKTSSSSCFQCLPCSGTVRLSVLVTGHGGRDTCLSFAVVEAVAFEPRLRDVVDVQVLTCSWDDDTWETPIIDYVKQLKDREIIPKSVQWELFKFRNSLKKDTGHNKGHGDLQQELRTWMQGKDLIVECEQGTDVFVPLWADKMQDNYEDWTVHAESLAYAVSSKSANVLLLQTNPDLDMVRGINAAELNQNIFEGKLQTNAFTQKLAWKRDALPPALLNVSGDGRANHAAGKKPETVVALGILLGATKDPKAAFEGCFGLTLQEEFPYSMQKEARKRNLYVGSVMHLVLNGVCPIPVVGMLESMTHLRLFDTPESVVDVVGPMPSPHWLLGFAWRTAAWEPARPRIVDEWRSAFGDLDKTASRRDWMWALMKYRRGRRAPVGGVFDVGARCREGFEQQLALAVEVAQHVRKSHPQFQLWKDPELLRRALARQPDQVDRSLFHNMRMMIVEFICVLLEATDVKQGLRHISKVVLPHLQTPDAQLKTFPPEDSVMAEWNDFKQVLVDEWERL